MHLNPSQCYAAICAHDTRFDGVFYVGVSTTGVYCRPVCRVRTPGRDRCSYYSSAAGAEAAGFRPCLRCRPELAPGAAPSDAVQRVARQAVARIESGALEDRGMEELAAEFGLSSRQLRRDIEREFGVPPVALAQTRRLLLAKQLITDTALPMTDVAFASGFSSVRRFNHLFQTRYRLKPSSLRRARLAQCEGRAVLLKLAYRPPYAWLPLARFLASRGAPGVERLEGERYLHTVRLGGKRGWIAAQPAPAGDVLQVEVSPELLPVLTRLLPRLRTLFDLDANPGEIAARLSGGRPRARAHADELLARLLRATPGLRVPGTLDGFNLALRTVLGQQVSVKSASTLYGRFVQRYGETIATPHAGLDRLSPEAGAIAADKPAALLTLGLTRRRAETVHLLAVEVAEGRLQLEPGGDAAAAAEALLAIPGIGPWTTQYIAMRALSDPDAFPHGDLVLLRAAGAKNTAAMLEAAERWRPWRAYAAMHLWHGASTPSPAQL